MIYFTKRKKQDRFCVKSKPAIRQRIFFIHFALHAFCCLLVLYRPLFVLFFLTQPAMPAKNPTKTGST